MGLQDKLKFKQEIPVHAYFAPDNLSVLLPGMEVKNGSKTNKGPISQVFFFAKNKVDIDANFESIKSMLTEDGVFWIAYPKKSAKIESDLIRDEGWDTVVNSDFIIVSSVAVDDTWSALRVKKKDPNAVYKRATPMEERKTEGVDYVKRTVKLPKDALEAMKPFKGLAAFFDSMAFSHKREYAEAIAEAKKPETRARRIEKMIEMVQQLQEKKKK